MNAPKMTGMLLTLKDFNLVKNPWEVSSFSLNRCCHCANGSRARRFLKQKNSSAIMNTIATKPPTTPPTMGPTLVLEKVSFGPGSSGAMRPAGAPSAPSVAVGDAVPLGCGVGSRFPGTLRSVSCDDSIGMTGGEVLGRSGEGVVEPELMLFESTVVAASSIEVEAMDSRVVEVGVSPSLNNGTDSDVDKGDVSSGGLEAAEEASIVEVSGRIALLVAAT